MTDLVVHHLESSRSQRILWLLEELEVPYELKRYARDPKTMRAPPELQQVHPLGRSPVVTIDDIVLAESGAIVEHLVDAYGEGRLRPEPGTEAHRRYRFFLHYAEGSLMPPLLVRLIFNTVRTAPLPFFLKPVVNGIVGKVDAAYTTPEITRHLSFLEGELESRQFFCGDDLTAADVQMSFPLESAAARGGLSDLFPKLLGYLERIHARPAYQRALERGGRYEILGG